MRLKIIQQLVNVNIIYASQPAQIAKLRAKQAKKPDVKLNVARKFGAQLSLFRPGLFPSYLACSLASMICSISQPSLSIWWSLFSLMTISQGFMSFLQCLL